MPVAYREVCVYKYYISSSERNLRKLCLANALNFHFSVKSRITPKTGARRGRRRSRLQVECKIWKTKRCHAHIENQSESWLDFCLSVCRWVCVCVCAEKLLSWIEAGENVREKHIKAIKKWRQSNWKLFASTCRGKKLKKSRQKNSEGGGEGNPRKIIIENANASMHLSLSGRGRQTGRRTKSKPKRKSSKCQLPNDILLLPRPLSSPVPPHLSLSLWLLYVNGFVCHSPWTLANNFRAPKTVLSLHSTAWMHNTYIYVWYIYIFTSIQLYIILCYIHRSSPNVPILQNLRTNLNNLHIKYNLMSNPLAS